jgi:hypothetical protein
MNMRFSKLTSDKKIALVAVGALTVLLAGTLAMMFGRGRDLAAKDCGSSRTCFYDAFEAGCEAAVVRTSQTTIEGDPIVVTAKTRKDATGTCIIAVTTDYSQDRFFHDPSGRKVFEDECGSLQIDKSREIDGVIILNALSCRDGEARSI